MKRDRREFLKAAAAGPALLGLPLAARAATGSADRMKIGTVGSGNVGGTLGGVWVKAGHQVMFSSRNLEHDKELAARLGPKAQAGTPREAAAFGEVGWCRCPTARFPMSARRSETY